MKDPEVETSPASAADSAFWKNAHQLWQDAPVFDWEQIAASLKFYRGPNSTLNGLEYQ